MPTNDELIARIRENIGKSIEQFDYLLGYFDANPPYPNAYSLFASRKSELYEVVETTLSALVDAMRDEMDKWKSKYEAADASVMNGHHCYNEVVKKWMAADDRATAAEHRAKVAEAKVKDLDCGNGVSGCSNVVSKCTLCAQADHWRKGNKELRAARDTLAAKLKRAEEALRRNAESHESIAACLSGASAMNSEHPLTSSGWMAILNQCRKYAAEARVTIEEIQK